MTKTYSKESVGIGIFNLKDCNLPVFVLSEFLIVIDCSGSPIAIESGINRVKHGGIFIQFGVAAQGATCKINPFHIYEREITIQG
jgi:threonine dehydrogenase-like Zn-dependent dehydrogenase